MNNRLQCPDYEFSTRAIFNKGNLATAVRKRNPYRITPHHQFSLNIQSVYTKEETIRHSLVSARPHQPIGVHARLPASAANSLRLCTYLNNELNWKQENISNASRRNIPQSNINHLNMNDDIRNGSSICTCYDVSRILTLINLLLRNISKEFQLRQEILLLVRGFAFDNEANFHSVLVIEGEPRLQSRIARKVRLHTINIGIDELVCVIASC